MIVPAGAIAPLAGDVQPLFPVEDPYGSRRSTGARMPDPHDLLRSPRPTPSTAQQTPDFPEQALFGSR